jgi:hypothetical protein
MFGDPHFTTFDNTQYDYQGVGEFIAVEDAGDPGFVVQIRLSQLNPGLSGASAIAAAVEGDKITVTYGGAITVNGAAFAPPEWHGLDGWSVEWSPEAALPHGGKILVIPRIGTVQVRWPTGEALIVTTYMAIGHRFVLNADHPRLLRGLLGTPDYEPLDDFTTRSGNILAQPLRLTELYRDFGDSWRISQAESLFNYAPGTSTATFTALTYPTTAPVISASARAAAMATCVAAGVTDQATLERCITDVAGSGEAGYADVAAAYVPPVKAGVANVTSSTGQTYLIQNGQPGPPATLGCADGQREGLNDLARFPHVAACLGSWIDAKDLRGQPSGTACGDDLRPCSAPADLCAPGWHICGTSGDPAELQRLSASDCEQAGGGIYLSALSYCSGNAGGCSYASSQSEPYGCTASGTCSEAVCCGAGCPGYGACADGVWPGRTHVITDGDGCGGAHARTAGGVLCCDGSASSALCAGVTLDDGNPCTRDSCDAAAGVRHVPVVGQSCSDGNACNGLETCDAAGACKPGVAAAVDDGNPCTADACDPTNGVTHAPIAGASCADANPCNGDETCSAAGICHAAAPAAAGTTCAADLCHVAASCDGGGACVQGTGVSVDDGNPCTIDACAPSVGVTHTVAIGAPCAALDACHAAGSCGASGACAPGAALPISDGNPCTVDSCDPVAGPQHAVVAAGTLCSDGDVCNGYEACNSGGTCTPGTPLVLDDGNPCTADSCDATRGVQHVTDQTCVGQHLILAAGGSHTCELKPDGTAVCWGSNSFGQATPPAGEVFVQLAAGENHTCGLRANGTVRCWGENTYSGELNVPAGAVFQQISSEFHTSCGLRTNGAISCWGYAPPQPDSALLFSSVSAGWYGACALKPDASVSCWGIAGAPTTGSYTQVSVGTSWACAVRTDGVVVCWGGDYGGNTYPPTDVTFARISTGNNAACGITTTGAVRCWGSNNYGQMAAPSGAFTRVSVGAQHVCAVRTDGVVVCWGSNANGQSTVPG